MNYRSGRANTRIVIYIESLVYIRSAAYCYCRK